ncbi:MAG: IucA/IucC family siderophore biosynthesis protein [Catenulispora sp.]|nr:IucA/IucC family siderophore biosynthesis protein [Catenulispora sp.]
MSPTARNPRAEAGAASETWRKAARALLAKCIGEFCYEGLLFPEPDPEAEGGDSYRLDLDHGVCYRFRADRGDYGSWFVEDGSLRRSERGAEAAAHDPLVFVRDAQGRLELPGDTAGHLIRELAATLSADVCLARGAIGAAELAELSYAELEGHMTGHPWIVFNKGRFGFSASDALRYAPEARHRVRLPWIAVDQDLAGFAAVRNLTSQRLYTTELDSNTRIRFGSELVRNGFNPARYWWLPVHPWQWDEMIQPLYGAEVAAGLIVPLGYADDEYLPQQSIRTFANVAHPERHHVKLPLSVLNTMVWRGLPTERTVAAPAVTEWLLDIADADPFLSQECRVILLGEVASVAVRHPVLDRMPDVPYQYRELLGSIWRQPLPPRLEPGERARTLAGLLHVDGEGRPLVAELVERSGLDGADWLDKLFAAVLPPLLHFLYKYGIVFNPHGENTVLVSDEREWPTRLAVKDFVDDVNISDKDLPELGTLPPDVAKVLNREAPDYLCQFIQSGLFIGHFRYLARLAEQDLDVDRKLFWGLVADRILDYQASFPQMADRFDMFDLFQQRIDRLCLNRNRLHLTGYRDRAERPHVEAEGTVPNPLSLG